MTFERVDIGDKATLYCGDCLEVLPTLEAGSIDAVVTDPPYGIGFKYESHNDTPDGYGEWLWKRIEMAERLCSSGAPVFVWQAMLNVRHFAEWFPRDWRIFAACKNFVQMRKTSMQYSYDPVVCWWTDGEQWTDKNGNRDYHIANTAALVSHPERIERQHPCPRPIDQLLHIVQRWVRPGATVADLFAGSGTAGVAAIGTGRKFIGVEIERKYFDIACKRIDDAAHSMPLLEACS